MKTFGTEQPTLLIDLKNYRAAARLWQRRRALAELKEEVLFLLGFVSVVTALYFALPILVPLL